MAGFTAIIFSAYGFIYVSIWIFLFSLVMDFSDGLAARLLKAQSESGKQLDSLADLVSFGLYPAVVLFVILEKIHYSFQPENSVIPFIPFIVLMIPAAGALRLARFNLGKAQKNFRGLPIPAAALGLISLVFVLEILHPANSWHQLFQSKYVVLGAVIIYSLLMITKIPMLSLKFQKPILTHNVLQLVFIFIIVTGFVIFKLMALPFLIPFYILFSLFALSIQDDQ